MGDGGLFCGGGAGAALGDPGVRRSLSLEKREGEAGVEVEILGSALGEM